MWVEHPELEPFESTLSRLMGITHRSGIWELEKKGYRLSDIKHSRSALRSFLRGCHYGYDLGQRQIAALVIEIEHTIAERTQELKELRRSRDREAKKVLNQIQILRSRQIILRRLVDSILHTIVRGENWLLRRFTIDLHIHPIDPVVLERTIQVAVDRNRGDRLKFNLVSDLSTVVQIGDLIEVDATAPEDRKWSVIELKQGRVNQLLTGMIGEKGADLAEADFESIKKVVSDTAPQQARRMLRQQRRMRELTRIVETDRGIDPLCDVEIHMTPDSVELQDYCGEIERAYELARQKGAGAADVDSCLRIFAVAQDKAKGHPRGSAKHQFFHMANPGRSCALVGDRSPADRDEEIRMVESVAYFEDLVGYNLMVPIADPIFIWPNQEMVLDLVMGRVRLFVQFDVEAFFRVAAKDKIKMRWITGKEAESIKKMSMRLPWPPYAWGIHVELPDGDTQTLLAGFISRPFANLATPRQLIDLIKRWPAQIAKTKFPET